jgi:hypothetical protein
VLAIDHTPPEVRELVKIKYGRTHPISLMLDDHPWTGDTSKLTTYLDQLDTRRAQNWRHTFSEVERYF